MGRADGTNDCYILDVGIERKNERMGERVGKKELLKGEKWGIQFKRKFLSRGGSLAFFLSRIFRQP